MHKSNSEERECIRLFQLHQESFHDLKNHTKSKKKIPKKQKGVCMAKEQYKEPKLLCSDKIRTAMVQK